MERFTTNVKERFVNLKKELLVREKIMFQLKRMFPIIVWIRNYTMEDLRYDIVAGVTVGITMVPQCLAYSALANLRAEIGLYSSFAGQFIYILMGTAKDSSVGPDAVICMIVGQICASANPLYDDGDPSTATILALVTGVILVAMAVFKLGFIVSLFSIPVVSGFMTAAGITIAASQLKSIFGLKKNPAAIPGVFVKHIKNVAEYKHINESDVAFGIISIAFLFFMQNLARLTELIVPRLVKLDNDVKKAKFAFALEAIKFVSACKNVFLFILSTGIAYGIYQAYEHPGVSLVGYLKPGMPNLKVPSFQIVQKNETVNGTEIITVIKDESQTMTDLIVGFIILPLMMVMELFAILKAIGSKNGYRVDARQELLAIGFSNIITAFLGGMPVTAAVTRTALNDQCRVRTQVGSIISAAIVIISLNTLTGVFYFIPKATLAAVVMVAALNLVDFHIIPDVWQHCRSDAVLLVLTILICVFFEISYGVLFCLFINIIMFLKAVVNMQIQVTRRHPDAKQFVFGDAEPACSIVIVKLSHGMKYPSVEKFLSKVEAILAKESHLIIDCTFVQSVDYTGIQAFRSILLYAVKKGLHVVFANLNDSVHKQLEKLGLEQFRFVPSIDAAIGEYNKAVILSELEGTAMEAIPEDRTVDILASSGDLIKARIASEKEMEEKTRQRLIRHLSVQPHCNPDFPLTVAGNVNYDSPAHEVPRVLDTDEEHPTGNLLSIDSKPTESNIQFLNHILLRELSRNSGERSIRRRSSTYGNRSLSPRFSGNTIGPISNTGDIAMNPTGAAAEEIVDAIAKITASPALNFVDFRVESNADGISRNSKSNNSSIYIKHL